MKMTIAYLIIEFINKRSPQYKISNDKTNDEYNESCHSSIDSTLEICVCGRFKGANEISIAVLNESELSYIEFKEVV